MRRIRLTHEERNDSLTNRCIELECEPGGFQLSAWRDDVNICVSYRGRHKLKTHWNSQGFEFDLVVKERPKTNEFIYNITIDNLLLVKQPSLTTEELKAGYIRPEHVVGSYAVYHRTMSNNFRFGDGSQRNYGSGKFGHIFKPKAIDADGRWTWCDLSIESGSLVVTAPEDFLRRARYPVTIDPIMGSNTGGASSTYPPGANRIWVYNNLCDDILVTLAGDGTVSNGYVYCRLDNAGAGNTESRMAVWQMVVGDEESSPRVLYSDPVDIDSEIPQWYPYPTLAGSISGGHSFGCGVTFNQYFSSPVHLYYDYMYFGILYGQEPTQSCTSGANTCIPTTLGYWGGSTSRWSVYAEYSVDPMGKLPLATKWKIGNIVHREHGFDAELRSRSQHLGLSICNLYSHECRATLGDSACGIDLEDSAGTYRYDGTVTSVDSESPRRIFIDTSLPSPGAAAVFTYGKILWSTPDSSGAFTGLNAGLQMEVKKHDTASDQIELLQSMPYSITVGDQFTLYYGCDKSVATCRDRFSNILNFRGEPYVPGSEIGEITKPGLPWRPGVL